MRAGSVTDSFPLQHDKLWWRPVPTFLPLGTLAPLLDGSAGCVIMRLSSHFLGPPTDHPTVCAAV